MMMKLSFFFNPQGTWLDKRLPDKNLICKQRSFKEMFRFVLPGFILRPLELSAE